MAAGSMGPFCQSCGMPMVKPEDFGTEKNGSQSSEYCVYCYAAGAFTTPDITMDVMLDVCVNAMEQHGVMPKAQARSLMTGVLPTLKRWRQPATSTVG